MTKNIIQIFIGSAFFLTGAFLFPKPAWLSSLNPENIINLTNQERSSANLNRLNINDLLTAAAQAKAKTIMQTGIFQHEINEKKFSYWIKEAGYQYAYAGENLAINFSNAQDIIDAWRQSPTHKKNLLGENFTDIGVAVQNGKFQNKETTLVVQIFGSPLVQPVKRLEKVLTLPQTEKSNPLKLKKTAIAKTLTPPDFASELIIDYPKKITIQNYQSAPLFYFKQTEKTINFKKQNIINLNLFIFLSFFILTNYYYSAHSFSQKLLTPLNLITTNQFLKKI